MEKTSIIIRDEKLRKRAAAIVGNIPIDGDLWEVVVQPFKKNYSAGQRKMYWKWCTIIGANIGNEKSEQHRILKTMFLLQIFRRDDEGFAQMINAVIALRDTDPSMAETMKKQIIMLTSITKCNVKQMREFLNEIESFAAELAIRLPHPDDLKDGFYHY